MTSVSSKILRKAGLFLSLSAAVLVAQDPVVTEEWQRLWEDANAREDLTEAERLLEQTNLVREAIQSGYEIDEAAWDRIAGLLQQWEGSSEIRLAREAYISVLADVCRTRLGSNAALPDEAGLREFLQKAQSLKETPREEGQLLLFLAESWLRSNPEISAHSRRVESLLQQAAAVLVDQPPLDAVHFRLGQLYQSFGLEAAGKSAGSSNSYLSQAVFHYRRVEEMEDARHLLKEKAEFALLDLLEPELEFEVVHRYLPQSDIRIKVRIRNIRVISVQMIGLFPGVESDPLTLDQLHEQFSGMDPTSGQIVFEREIPVRGRSPHDWRSREIRLGENFPGGWYGVRIRGEGLEKKELLLVTPLEVVAFPRETGQLLVWTVDAETGQPVFNARVTVFGSNGQIVAQQITDVEGFSLFVDEELGDWSEIQIQSGKNPGHLRRKDMPEAEPRMPWVIVNPIELQPGGELKWSIVGLDNDIPPEFDPGPVFSLPDGSVLESDATASGPGWLAGEIPIPDSVEGSGPIHVLLPGDRRLIVSHIRDTRDFPLRVDLSGDRLDNSLSLFHSSTPIGVHVYPVPGMTAELPEFIRSRVTALQRQPISASLGSAQVGVEPILFESIMPFQKSDPGGVYFELPDFPVLEGIRPILVQILGLNSGDILGEAYLGIAQFRQVVQLGISQRIVLPGESAEITLQAGDDNRFADQSSAGELVVFRETWESRYIHRKRGIPISETEYMDLPDRSLLGAAKTDYRLQEQGFIRNEVRRIPVEVDNALNTVEVTFDRPGYYNIEFDGRDGGIRPEYPDGDLEVWVLPQDDDLRSFHSDRPRLVIEENEDGATEILVLLDRAGTSVITDLVARDGQSLTTIHRPADEALFQLVGSEEGNVSGFEVCRVMIVGELRSDLISAEVGDDPPVEWDLDSESLFGLNPGVPFDWSFRTSGAPAMESILWTFFPDTANALAPARLQWQRSVRSPGAGTSGPPVFNLSRWLPLSHPFLESGSDNDETGSRVDFLDPAEFLSLYPETLRYPPALPAVLPFQAVEERPEEHTFNIMGEFPNEAGRWYLTLFGATLRDELEPHSWLVSTELPIRSTLRGPSLVRIGDLVSLPLTLENTTHRQVDLNLSVTTPGSSDPDPAGSVRISLAPTQREVLPVRTTVEEPGVHPVKVSVDGGRTVSETIHELEVVSDPPHTAFEFRLAPPQESLLKSSFTFNDWSTGKVIVASGLGTLLPEIWPIIRESQGRAEPLLATLGEWAVWRVLRHHGAIGPREENPSEAALARELVLHQAESGGWGLDPGSDAEPWLSSLVLWTLELFADQEDRPFADVRRQARSYLESILVDEDLDPESRLFALRALAVRGFHSNEIRPSRIQARSFLDFLHRRSTLSDVEVSLLLQVAKAYRFHEEIRLLSMELRRRPPSESMDFWTSSLKLAALDERESGGRQIQDLLLDALKALSGTGPHRGWEQVAGFLNLLSSYYWKGDFYRDGRVEVAMNDGPFRSLSLNPDITAHGMLTYELDEVILQAGQVDFSFNTTSALSPAIVAAIGSVENQPEPVILPGVRMQMSREFKEKTLLDGTKERSVQLSNNLDGIHVGDTLRLVFDLELENPRSIAELHFPFPAGLELTGNPVDHVWESPEEESDQSLNVWSETSVPGEILSTMVRLEPLPAGRHRFSFTLRATWAGTYKWPEPVLFIPKEGLLFRLTEARSLVILPESD